MHAGVGIIIGNFSKELFFIQIKDEHYPIKKWAGSFSFWGGEIEPADTSPLAALKRELREEIIGELDTSNIKFVDKFLVESDNDFWFHLFELSLPDETLHYLKEQGVDEGNCEIVTKDELLTQKWIWGLENVFEYYIKNHKSH